MREINEIIETSEETPVVKIASKEVISSFWVDNIEKHVTVWVEFLDDNGLKMKTESYYFGSDVFAESLTEEYLWSLIDGQRKSTLE